MTEQGDHHEEHPPAARSGAKLSILAVASLGLAIVPLCPPVNLLAAVLGMFAARRIMASGGRLRGLNYARAAVFAGLVLGVFSFVLISRFQRMQQQRIDEAILDTTELIIHAAQQNDPAVVQSMWITLESAPDEASIEAFGRALTDRFGVFSHFSVISSLQTGTAIVPRIEVAGVFSFSDANLNGSVEFNIQFESLLGPPRCRVRSLLLEDPDEGDLALPPRVE